jgi:hypothetical protein
VWVWTLYKRRRRSRSSRSSSSRSRHRSRRDSQPPNCRGSISGQRRYGRNLLTAHLWEQRSKLQWGHPLLRAVCGSIYIHLRSGLHKKVHIPRCCIWLRRHLLPAGLKKHSSRPVWMHRDLQLYHMRGHTHIAMDNRCSSKTMGGVLRIHQQRPGCSSHSMLYRRPAGQQTQGNKASSQAKILI